MTTFEQIKEVVGQAIFDYFPNRDEKGTPLDKEDALICDKIGQLLEVYDTGYVLVEWPDSQNYMEEEWFEEEAILALGSEDITGSSAYFIPIKRIV